MTNIQPPELVNPHPDFSRVTIQDLIDRGLMHKDKMTEAATKAAERFEKIRPKMDVYRNLRGF